MVNDVLNGIITKLRAINTEKVNIYTDEHKQGLVLPCYFVRLLNYTAERVVGDRYKVHFYFDIEYHSASDNAVTREYNEVMSALCLQLEYITIDGKLERYSSLSCEIQDKVLHTFVEYDLFLRLVPEQIEKMMVLIHHHGVKE